MSWLVGSSIVTCLIWSTVNVWEVLTIHFLLQCAAEYEINQTDLLDGKISLPRTQIREKTVKRER